MKCPKTIGAKVGATKRLAEVFLPQTSVAQKRTKVDVNAITEIIQSAH